MENKICTSLEQSKKLLELGVDINTADMCYRIVAYNPNNTHVYQPYCFIGTLESDIPAWSLSALFSILPKSARLEKGSSTELYRVSLPVELKGSDWYLDPMDAVFEAYCLLNRTN